MRKALNLLAGLPWQWSHWAGRCPPRTFPAAEGHQIGGYKPCKQLLEVSLRALESASKSNPEYILVSIFYDNDSDHYTCLNFFRTWFNCNNASPTVPTRVERILIRPSALFPPKKFKLINFIIILSFNVIFVSNYVSSYRSRWTSELHRRAIFEFAWEFLV